MNRRIVTGTPDDSGYMKSAFALARRGLGSTWPNPSVGCVLVKDHRIVGRGFTQPGGRPHAEIMALAMAQERARGASAYISLEPCSHTGKTPPCCEALINAGIVRAVVSNRDPDPRVSGRGLDRLRTAGIEVAEGVGLEEGDAINRGFFAKILLRRPMVTLKMATSLDGKSALSNGRSQWITGERARAAGHMLRASHDAILVGAATIAADNPALNCRVPGLAARSPLKIVLDRQAALTPDHRVFAKDSFTWLVVGQPHAQTARNRFGDHIEVISASLEAGHLDLGTLMGEFADRGITRLLVESGGRLAAALLKADLVDRLVWFKAPGIIGAEGQNAVGALGVTDLARQYRFRPGQWVRVGQDGCWMLERAAPHHFKRE